MIILSLRSACRIWWLSYCCPTAIACAVHIIPGTGGLLTGSLYIGLSCIIIGLSCMPSHESCNRLRCSGVVNRENADNWVPIYIHGVPIFVWVPIFMKSLSEQKWMLIFMGCLLSQFYGICAYAKVPYGPVGCLPCQQFWA